MPTISKPLTRYALTDPNKVINTTTGQTAIQAFYGQPASSTPTINSSVLMQRSSVQPPTPTTPTPVSIAGGQAVIDANAKALTATTPSGAIVDTTTGALITPPPPTPTETPTSRGLDALFAKYFG